MGKKPKRPYSACVCSRAEWVHLWEHQQLHVNCERLFPADRGEKRLLKTVFRTSSLFTRFLTVITITDSTHPGSKHAAGSLKHHRRRFHVSASSSKTLVEGNSARKRQGSPRDSLLNCLIELLCLVEGPSLLLLGLNYALQAVSGDET